MSDDVAKRVQRLLDLWPAFGRPPRWLPGADLLPLWITTALGQYEVRGGGWAGGWVGGWGGGGGVGVGGAGFPRRLRLMSIFVSSSIVTGTFIFPVFLNSIPSFFMVFKAFKTSSDSSKFEI